MKQRNVAIGKGLDSDTPESSIAQQEATFPQPGRQERLPK
jgi:hypothetical protein